MENKKEMELLKRAVVGNITLIKLYKALMELGTIEFTGKKYRKHINYYAAKWNIPRKGGDIEPPEEYNRLEKYNNLPVHKGSIPEGDYWWEYTWRGEISYRCENDGDFIAPWYQKFGYLEEVVSEMRDSGLYDNFEYYKEGAFAMSCRTLKEAKAFCKFLSDHGKTWVNGDSYLEENFWDNLKSSTCYTSNGKHGGVSYYKQNGYKILYFSNYIGKNLEAEEDLKVFTK